MIQKHKTVVSSPYMTIYDLIVPADTLLRKINDLVDFSFAYEELENKYCHDNGRNAIDPIRMFKYLLLKTIFDLSDVDVGERSQYDMSFKYFLGMTQGNRKKEDEFIYNKDADMFVCKAGHLAIRKKRHGKAGAGKNPTLMYYFDPDVTVIGSKTEG